MSGSIALTSNVTSFGSPLERRSPRSSSGSSTLADFPLTSSERKFALLSQTSLPPPKNGSVCSAAIVERIAVAAPSTLSAAPSIISSPNSPASAGASCLASSVASRFTRASSEPTIARMLAVVVLVLALGTAMFFACTRSIHKIGDSGLEEAPNAREFNGRQASLPVSDGGHACRWPRRRQAGSLSAESGWKPNFQRIISVVGYVGFVI